MKSTKYLLAIPLFFIAFGSSAQFIKDSTATLNSVSDNHPAGIIESKELYQRKGKFFFYWGYNRAAYSNSDIHFSGDGYDFSITNVTATDQPEPFSITYIRPASFTVPEYNYRLGYYLTDKIFISLGEDHMKYAIDKQTTRLTGTISKDNNNGKNKGTYNDKEVLVGDGDGKEGGSIIDSLPKGFVSGFEHCDGLNDVSLDLGRLEQLWMSKDKKRAFAVVGTVGIGMVIPDSDADVLGYAPKHDMGNGQKDYHLAGYSFSASFGLQFDFSRSFFVLARLKGGYINLPDINTTIEGGKASQHFTFIEPMVVVGYTHDICKHKK